MKTKKYGVVGYKGKIGSLLVERPDFVPVDVYKNLQGADLIVNCSGMSSIDMCETQYKRAVELNVSDLRVLHQRFGSKVLNLGSEQIYSGGLFTHKETSTPNPINSYGLTKVAAESVSNAFDGKTIRLSRSVSITDPDIWEFIQKVRVAQTPIYVPIYMWRNYLTRGQVVDGIEWFVWHYDNLPHIVNYGNLQRVSYYTLVKSLIQEIGFDDTLVKPKFLPDRTKTPRPHFGGLNISLAEELGFPMFDLSDTVSDLRDEYAQSFHSLTSV